VLNINAINDLLEAEIRKIDRKHLALLNWMLENHPEIYEEYEASRMKPKEKRQDLAGKVPVELTQGPGRTELVAQKE
jgi:hypothetical protein